MGYLSSLILIDVKIKAESEHLVEARLPSGRGRMRSALQFFLSQVVLDRQGFLAFEASSDGRDPYVPDEDGTVPASEGKWYDAELIAGWLKLHSEKGGRLVLHSMEADGEAWGWEFNGRGRMRALRLRPVGKWE